MKLISLSRLISIVSILLLLSAWSAGGGVGNSREQGRDLFSELVKLAEGETHIIEIPTYEGSGQVVHPDILIKNNKFYLAITPYPYSNHDYENPSLFISSNGIDFYLPEGLQNPIVPMCKSGYNDDPDILFDSKTKMFYLYYLETLRCIRQYVVLMNSKDGIKWNKEDIIKYDLRAGDTFIVSPAVIKKNKDYIMFYVDISELLFEIKYLKSANGIHWNKKKTYRISIDYPFYFSPWHIDVFEHNGKYYMLINGFKGIFWHKQYLYLAESDNLVDWHFRKEPIISPSRAFYNSEKIYRSTGLIHNNNMFVWFSFKTYDKKWRLGVKKISLENLKL